MYHFSSSLNDSLAIRRGKIESIDESGTPSVAIEDEPAVPCDVLVHDDRIPRFEVGDDILVWTQPDANQRAVILGHIAGGVSVRKGNQEAVPSQEVPEELVLEAKHSLTLRVGEGSITIREDGKILIKGKDLVSHAQRMNRIKGGAVAIN